MAYVVHIEDLVVSNLRIFVVSANNKLMASFHGDLCDANDFS